MITASDRVFQSSDLRKDRKFIDAAREGVARLRDTDGESFVMLAERDFGRLNRERESLDYLVRVTRTVLLLDLALHRDLPLQTLLGATELPWLKVLGANDLHEFVEELQSALADALAENDGAHVAKALEAWRETARALDDSERHAALTAPIDADEFVEIQSEAEIGTQVEAASS